MYYLLKAFDILITFLLDTKVVLNIFCLLNTVTPERMNFGWPGIMRSVADYIHKPGVFHILRIFHTKQFLLVGKYFYRNENACEYFLGKWEKSKFLSSGLCWKSFFPFATLCRNKAVFTLEVLCNKHFSLLFCFV